MIPAARIEDIKPLCGPCSAKWHDTVPARVTVDRFTLVRDVTRTTLPYVGIAHCHGDSTLVDFGHEAPSDDTIRNTFAFRSP